MIAVITTSFATMMTAHASIVWGLLRHRSFAHAASGLVLPPLSAYWAWLEGMTTRTVIWLVAALIYIGSLVVAYYLN
ncbi:MAG: hypothetical protein FWD57_09400 [Polyangiaceae bacterium]|nr:hypothetical protein [Polyangiaceae bacterium]